MCGYDCLWVPGMDHTATVTDAKVVKRLKEQGINKYDYGRENFLKSSWDWANERAEIIRKQWSKLGISLDYTKERFTLDEGLIYRGETGVVKRVPMGTKLKNMLKVNGLLGYSY